MTNRAPPAVPLQEGRSGLCRAFTTVTKPSIVECSGVYHGRYEVFIDRGLTRSAAGKPCTPSAAAPRRSPPHARHHNRGPQRRTAQPGPAARAVPGHDAGDSDYQPVSSRSLAGLQPGNSPQAPCTCRAKGSTNGCAGCRCHYAVTWRLRRYRTSAAQRAAAVCHGPTCYSVGIRSYEALPLPCCDLHRCLGRWPICLSPGGSPANHALAGRQAVTRAPVGRPSLLHMASTRPGGSTASLSCASG